MSFGLAFNYDSLNSFRELEIWLQEETLDELEDLGGHPELLRPRLAAATAVYDFVRRHEGLIHYVFLMVDRDDKASLLRILRLGHTFRSMGEPAP